MLRTVLAAAALVAAEVAGRGNCEIAAGALPAVDGGLQPPRRCGTRAARLPAVALTSAWALSFGAALCAWSVSEDAAHEAVRHTVTAARPVESTDFK